MQFPQLWIALKFCIFARLKQLISELGGENESCELLSNFVSLHVWNNKMSTQEITR